MPFPALPSVQSSLKARLTMLLCADVLLCYMNTSVRPTLLRHGLNLQQCDEILREIFSLEHTDVDADTKPLSRSNSDKVRWLGAHGVGCQMQSGGMITGLDGWLLELTQGCTEQHRLYFNTSHLVLHPW